MSCASGVLPADSKGSDGAACTARRCSEVVKRRGEEYQLLWRESPDFVRLATKCKAIIIPFAAVGADDA